MDSMALAQNVTTRRDIRGSININGATSNFSDGVMSLFTMGQLHILSLAMPRVKANNFGDGSIASVTWQYSLSAPNTTLLFAGHMYDATDATAITVSSVTNFVNNRINLMGRGVFTNSGSTTHDLIASVIMIYI